MRDAHSRRVEAEPGPGTAQESLRPLAKTAPLHPRLQELRALVTQGGDPDARLTRARKRLHLAIDAAIDAADTKHLPAALRAVDEAERAYIDALSAPPDGGLPAGVASGTGAARTRCGACGADAARVRGGRVECLLCNNIERSRCGACGADAHLVGGQVRCPLCEEF